MVASFVTWKVKFHRARPMYLPWARTRTLQLESTCTHCSHPFPSRSRLRALELRPSAPLVPAARRRLDRGAETLLRRHRRLWALPLRPGLLRPRPARPPLPRLGPHRLQVGRRRRRFCCGRVQKTLWRVRQAMSGSGPGYEWTRWGSPKLEYLLANLPNSILQTNVAGLYWIL